MKQAAAGDGVKRPSVRQQQILDEYFEVPIAAAVARKMRMSERNVRRIVEEFADILEERRKARNQEHMARGEARVSGLQDWADAAQRANLQALDELANSSNEAIKLSAVKVRQQLIDQLPSSPVAASALDAALGAKEREVTAAIEQVEPFPVRRGSGEAER